MVPIRKNKLLQATPTTTPLPFNHTAQAEEMEKWRQKLREDFETTRRKRAAGEDEDEVMRRNKYHSAGHRYPKIIGKKEKKRRKMAHPIGPSPGNRALYLPRAKDERVPAITRGGEGADGAKAKELGPLGGKTAISKVSRGAM